MKATLVILFAIVGAESCSKSAKMEVRAPFSTMKACYESLAKANIPDNAVSVCIEREDDNDKTREITVVERVLRQGG